MCSQNIISVEVVNTSIILTGFLLRQGHPSRLPAPPAPTSLLSFPLDEFAYSRVLYKWNHAVYTLFCWASFTYLLTLRFTHVVPYVNNSFCWLLHNIPCMNTLGFVYPFICLLMGDQAFSSHCLLQIKLPWTFMNRSLCGCMPLFLLGQYLEITWLHHTVDTCFTF